MNILIPHHWLLDHLDTQASPPDIQKSLSLCGPSVERIETIENEPVYDIEVTTNRVDAMSVRGIAREAATILPEFGINAVLKPLAFDSDKLKDSYQHLPPIDLQITNDPNLCHRILAITMSVDTVGDSPDWLQKRLLQVGQRPLNNLIDITNFVMWEIGHPIHVFDYDKLTQKKLLVREAKSGEKLITLDGKTHTSNGGEVVFDDSTGTIIDLPGIMGTKNSVVDENTKNILVWIEDVPAKLIRKASMGLSIRTQAAVLNEKNVDPNQGANTLSAAIELYQQLSGAKATSQIYDDWPTKPETNSIQLTQQLIDTYLGTPVEPDRISRILTTLGCHVEHHQDTYTVTPPTSRTFDLQLPQDLIEEIARIYGYHNLDSRLMDTPIPDVDTNLNHPLEHKIKATLANWGLHEVYTYSLVSTKLAEKSGYPLTNHTKLQNPLTDDLVYLRRSLIPSHAEVFAANKSASNLSIFELANVYEPQSLLDNPTGLQSPVTENFQLVISTTNSFVHLKTILDQLITKLRIANYSVKPELDSDLFPEFELQKSGQIYSGDTLLGCLGQTKLGFYSVRLHAQTLMRSTQPHPEYTPIPTTSPIIQDLTFTLPERTHTGLVIGSIKNLDPLVHTVTPKDVYQQNHTFTITYQDLNKQLADTDVQPIRNKIIDTLKSDYHASLVGQK